MNRILDMGWKALCALVAPSAVVQEPENRRRALLLSTLLLIYLMSVWGMFATIMGGRFLGKEPLVSDGAAVLVLICSILFSFFFILARTRHYVIAGICFCLTIDIGIVSAVYFGSASSSYTDVLPFLIVPVLIAMFVLPLRAVLSLAAASLLCAIVIVAHRPSTHNAIMLSSWFFFVVLALVIAGSLLRTFDIKQMEDERLQLFHAARMSTLGEMAGGIAHEVNNPVAVIQLRASQALRVLQQKPQETEKVVEFLEAIKRTASHIENVVRNLRSFSRSGRADPFVVTPLRTIISETLALCEEHLRHVNVDLKVEPFDESLAVECRSVQISQVLLNLISNARAGVADLPERWIRIAVEDKGTRVAVSVTDSGRGISSAVAKRIFEPFFTTKQDGLGTGIGLSISFNLAKHHNGTLYFDQGSPHTRFVLELPKTQPGGRTSS